MCENHKMEPRSKEPKVGEKTKCPLCPRELSFSYMLQSHLRAHTKEKPFICDQCDFEAVIKRSLQYHVAKVHDTNPEEIMVKCPLCPQEFRWKFLLQAHLMSHTKEKPFFCDLCEYESSSRLSLEVHINKRHPGEGSTARLEELKVFKCEECDYKAYRKSLLRLHQVRHDDERPFPCSIPGCEFRAKLKGVLKQHLKIHSIVRSYSCPVSTCSYTAKSNRYIGMHMVCHNTERNFACEFQGCTMRFTSKGRLTQHRRIHDANLQFKCSFPNCDFRTPQSRRLTQHKFKHISQDKPYHCKEPGCENKYESDWGLRYHIRTKHSESPPQYTCPYPNCNRAFCTKQGLNHHCSTHMTEKPLKCSKCNYQAQGPVQLKNHDRLEHRGRQPVRCSKELCTYKTHYPSNLRHHLDQHERDPDYRYYLCDVTGCKFTSSNVDTFSWHVRSHSDQSKRVACSFCPKSFAHRSDFEAHVAVHTRERHFKCLHCSYAAAQRGALRRHLKVVHGKESTSQKDESSRAISTEKRSNYLGIFSKFPFVTLERICIN